MSVQRRNTEYEQNMVVYGYIRKEKFLISMDIPDVLIEICLMFYLLVLDEWNIELSDKHLKFDTEQRLVTLTIGLEYSAHYLNAFGTILIGKGERESWTFKVSNTGRSQNTVSIAVGIIDYNKWISASDNKKVGAFAAPGKNFGIVYHGRYGRKYVNIKGDKTRGEEYGSGWRPNQSLTMIVDLTNDDKRGFGKISFRKGGLDLGILYDEIDLSRQYCMGISVIKKCTVQLIEE